jgi:hypothetical protein
LPPGSANFQSFILAQLRKYHLLEEGSGSLAPPKVSRRDLVRKYLPLAT